MSTTTTVNIACPDWCTWSLEQHQRDIENGERHLIHLSVATPERRDWILVMMQSPEGAPEPTTEGYADVMLHDGDDAVHPDDAERLAHALLEMVATARGQQVLR